MAHQKNGKTSIKLWITRLLSIVLTPFIVFIVTASELYVHNKTDLGDRTIVLLPFIIAFLLATTLGLILFIYRNKNRLLKFLLSMYYAFGPIFMLSKFTDVLSLNFGLETSLLFLTLIALSVFIYIKLETNKFINNFAWFSVALMLYQAFVLFSPFGAVANNSNISEELNIQKTATGNSELPNIYHIILDEYQTDMFNLTLNEQTSSKMGGFTYYPNNTTVFGRTGMSFPSIFTGKTYDFSRPQIEYQQEAFNSDKSYLHWLKNSGYKTSAYIHKIYTFEQPLFDEVIEHSNNADTKVGDLAYTKLFVKLWLYANAPPPVAERFIGEDFAEQLKSQNVLPDAAPVLSRDSFMNITNDHQKLDEPNSYRLIHLILPHFPYILKSDCSYYKDTDSTPLEQSYCATKLMVDFLENLKKLDRYDNSLIIIQSDHGARFKVQNNQLVKLKEDYYSEDWSYARSRALLLIKTPGQKSTDQFKINNSETTLLDVAPTIIDSIGIDTSMEFEGFSLSDGDTDIKNRTRYYHFFDKKGKNELTDQIHRYIIEGQKIREDGILKVPN